MFENVIGMWIMHNIFSTEQNTPAPSYCTEVAGKRTGCQDGNKAQDLLTEDWASHTKSYIWSGLKKGNTEFYRYCAFSTLQLGRCIH